MSIHFEHSNELFNWNGYGFDWPSWFQRDYVRKRRILQLRRTSDTRGYNQHNGRPGHGREYSGHHGRALVTRKLRHTTNYFVLNLSVADLLTSTGLPFVVVAILGESWPLPDFICVAAGGLMLSCLTCSINCLACVALNRYILITKPLTLYRRIYTPRRTILAIVITWFVPLCVSSVPACTGFIKLGFDPEFFVCTWIISESNPNYYMVFFCTSFILQFFIIMWSYIQVFHHVRKHAKAVGHMDGTAPSAGPTSRRVDGISKTDSSHQVAPKRPSNKKLQIDVTKNLFFVVCVFTICITPFGVSLILGPYGRRLYPIGATLLASNSCVNPIIYAAKHPQFRTVFRSIILCRFSEIPDRVRFF